MPRTLTAGLIVLSALLVACSNVSSTSGLNIGPNFSKGTLYVANSTQNGVSIYAPNEGSGKGPIYQIGGGSTDLNGPQYVAFDKQNNIWVTNYNPSTQSAEILEFEALATGNVIPFGLISGSTAGVVRPLGIAINATTGQVIVANVNPSSGASFSSQLLLFDTAAAVSHATAPGSIIAGPNTQMNIPSGVALSGTTAYVTNLQGASVEAFAIPTPTPTPTPPTPSPSPTPSPTATPTAPTPTPSPTPTPENLSPTLVLAGNLTGITKPSGIALDSSGNVYVSDEGSASVKPSILVFPTGLSGSVNVAPSCKIGGTNTNLFAPTDVAVDSSGNIFVADTTASGAGVVYVFSGISPTCGTANVAPSKTFTSTGVPVGLGVLP
jgi:hypothetical protein